MKKVNIGVIGCLGKQGRHLVHEISASCDAQVSAGLVRVGNEHVGKSLSSVIGCSCDAKITDSLEQIFDISDIIIEFTNPGTMLECMKMAEKKKKPMLSGSTGAAVTDMVFADYVKSIPFLWAANVSFGVNILAELIENAAKAFDGYDVEVWEMHHRYKKDAPSGTSLILGKAAAKGMNTEFKMKQYVRGGQESREDRSIGYAVSRGGGGLSDHKVMFVSDEEMIEFSHRTLNKSLYAMCFKGSVMVSKAACWYIHNVRYDYAWKVIYF